MSMNKVGPPRLSLYNALVNRSTPPIRAGSPPQSKYGRTVSDGERRRTNALFLPRMRHDMLMSWPLPQPGGCQGMSTRA